MFTAFKATLSPMLVMFLCIVVGYVLKKKQLLPDNADKVLSKLETCVLVPALNINTFIRYCNVASLGQHYTLILISTVVVLVAIAIAYALSGFFEKDAYKKNIYRYALTFGNYGFMGNAIVPAILGEEMLYPYLLFTLPLALAGYAWGMTIMIPKGEARQNPLKNLLNPGVLSIVIGILLGLVGAEPHMPAFVTTALNNLAGCMGPVAMVLTGFVIGSYKFKLLLKKPGVYVATLLRLFILPAVFVAGLLLLKVDTTTVLLCLFAYATPLGLNTVVFPAAYGGDTSTGASMAMISHTLCVVTIPLMYALLTVVIQPLH